MGSCEVPGNGNLYVPGIRVLFFASRLGGYKPFATINDHDYQFIVDLPKLSGQVSPWYLGHTTDFPLNTGVLRAPHLLYSVQFLNSGDGAPGNVQPTWEPVPAAAPGQLPEQIKLTFPLTQLPADTTYYGVIVNFGWFDPDQSPARRVKRCKIHFDHFQKMNVNHDVFSEEWMLKFGVNGSLVYPQFHRSQERKELSAQRNVPEFYLADTDSIYISSHGAEMDQMDDVFQRTRHDRTLQLNGTDVDWDRDVVAGTADPDSNAANRQRLWDMVYAIGDMLPGGDAFLNFLGIEDGRGNNPLGMIDPVPEGNPDRRPDNPLAVKDLNLDAAPHQQVAFYVKETGETAELIEHTNTPDYILHYDVTIKPQLA